MKAYKEYFIIEAEPDIVYVALTNPHTIQLWTGEVAEMSTEIDSEFSLWSGNIVGKNLEFVEGKKIVQQWYFDTQTEPSIVTIMLHEHRKGTSIELRHSNIPDEDYEEIVKGWKEMYFADLTDFYKD